MYNAARPGVGHQSATDGDRLCPIDGLGWLGFDPANGLCPTERYVRLACGLDSFDASPIRGALTSHGTENLVASVDISQANSQTQQ